jgi:hypothetical protein
MSQQYQLVVDQILGNVRQTVLSILESGATDVDVEIAFEGAASNGEAACAIWRKGWPPHCRLIDGARDMVLALACLQLKIPPRAKS